MRGNKIEYQNYRRLEVVNINFHTFCSTKEIEIRVYHCGAVLLQDRNTKDCSIRAMKTAMLVTVYLTFKNVTGIKHVD